MVQRKSFNDISRLWWWYASVWAIIGTCLSIGYLTLILLAGTGEVFTVVEARPIITTAKQGGAISYSWTQDRRENCPGTVVSRFTPLDGDSNAVVTQERPVAYTEPKLYKNLPITLVLPQSVTPGRWRLLDGVKSDCLDRSRYDRIIEFEFTVTEH